MRFSSLSGCLPGCLSLSTTVTLREVQPESAALSFPDIQGGKGWWSLASLSQHHSAEYVAQHSAISLAPAEFLPPAQAEKFLFRCAAHITSWLPLEEISRGLQCLFLPLQTYRSWYWIQVGSRGSHSTNHNCITFPEGHSCPPEGASAHP